MLGLISNFVLTAYKWIGNSHTWQKGLGCSAVWLHTEIFYADVGC